MTHPPPPMPTLSLDLPLAVDGGDERAASKALDQAAIALSLAGRRLALARIFSEFSTARHVAAGMELSLSWTCAPAQGPDGEDLHDVQWLLDGEPPPGSQPSANFLRLSGRMLATMISNHALAEAEDACEARMRSGAGPLSISSPEQAAAWFLTPAEASAWLADFERRRIAQDTPPPVSERRPAKRPL